MNESLIHAWWVPALRGVIAILFGIAALAWPGLTLLVLVSLFAAYALLSGIAAIVGAVKNRRADDHWWLMLLIGLVGVGAAIVTWIRPGMTALVLVLVMGANALLTGMLDIVTAIRLRREIHDEWLLGLSGLAAVIFGVLVFLFPAAGALALVWLISLYAVVTGVLLLGVAYRLRARARGEPRRMERRSTPDRRAHA
jgi:uncharacterized membrane protein HdeD (DUF308 family)